MIWRKVMPLKKGKSSKTISANIKELMKKPGEARSKAIKSISKSQGITPSEAKRKQAVAIALTSAGKVRK
jgi:hypothetical protein